MSRYWLTLVAAAAIWYPINQDGLIRCWGRGVGENGVKVIRVVPLDKVAEVCDPDRNRDFWLGKGWDRGLGWYDSETGERTNVEPPK